MCGSCVTNVEAVVLTGATATSAAVSVGRRALDILRGRSSSHRNAAAYAANAGFLRSLGHDPVLVLGPAPVVTPATASRAGAAPAGALLGT